MHILVFCTQVSWKTGKDKQGVCNDEILMRQSGTTELLWKKELNMISPTFIRVDLTFSNI